VTQPKDIIAELRRARRQLLVNQHDLAERVGYDRTTIARYEAGGHQPEHLHMLCNWAEALGYNLALVKK
jgi:transcriptional regulator with XRE-family HTH domain